MKRILLGMFFIFALSLMANAQTVSVSQAFVDDCTKAFDLVAEQRDAIVKFQNERAKTEAERQAAQSVIDGLNGLITIKNQTIDQYKSAMEFQTAQYESIIKLQQGVIALQQTVIERLEKLLNKPKSFLDKLFKTLERVAILAGGILIGRGIAF